MNAGPFGIVLAGFFHYLAGEGMLGTDGTPFDEDARGGFSTGLVLGRGLITGVGVKLEGGLFGSPGMVGKPVRGCNGCSGCATGGATPSGGRVPMPGWGLLLGCCGGCDRGLLVLAAFLAFAAGLIN